MIVKAIDLFGAEFQLKVFDSKKYKTVHGGLFTLFAVLMMGVIVILFGRDFIFKLNPKIFSKKEIPAKPRMISPTNQNFSIMWKVELDDTSLVPEDKTVFFPFFEFITWRRDENNLWQIESTINPSPKRCDQTSNTENPSINSLSLDVWHCLDWDEIAAKLGSPAEYGGQWDSDLIRLLRLNFMTCPYDTETKEFDTTDCSTIESVAEALSKGTQYFSFNLPNYSFDTTDFESPVNVDYRYIFFRASSQIALTQYFYFTQETIFDDRGWILEDNLEREAISFDSTSTVTRFLGQRDFDSSKVQNYFSAIFYLTKEEKQYFRSYLKVQELFANIGGILKIIIMVFGYLSREISYEMLEIDLLNTKIKRNNTGTDHIPFRLPSRADKSGSVSRMREEAAEKLKLSFFQILAYKSKCFKKNLRKHLEKRKKEVLGGIDVCNLIKREENLGKSLT